MSKVYNQYRKIIKADENFIQSNVNVQVTGEVASDLIKKYINSDSPMMISRFGANELDCILNYFFIKRGLLGNALNVLTGVPYFFNFKKNILHNMHIHAGFFPATEKNLERFSEMSLQDISEIDVLGSWLKHEKYLINYFNPAHVRVQLEDLSPFIHTNPWSEALKGKKVLIIHPFEESIINQYKKREFIFKDKRVLPEFELRTIKAVQSIADSKTTHKNWFEALDDMTEQIDKIDFDIAILGCGAYGMPLAARIKRMGKKSIHIGGAVQCLFGIKGKRWEIPSYNYQNIYYNDYWVRPLEEEKPKRATDIEDGCYW